MRGGAMESQWIRNAVLIGLAPVIIAVLLVHPGERHDAAEAGLRTAQESHLLDDDLGRHLHMGLVVVGWIHTSGDGGTASLMIPVFGSRGRGRLYAWEHRDRYGWHVCSLDFRVYTRRPFRYYRGPLKTIISDQNCARE
jgi:Cytochrome oxidase complex assembly protein 1